MEIQGRTENSMIKSEYFNMGQIVVTRSINSYMAKERKFALEITIALQRYSMKDWETWTQKINRQMRRL